MLGSNIGRLRKLATLVGASALVVAIAACAASTNTRPSGVESSSIDDVRVERDGAATTVTLMGVEEPVWVTCSMSNPGAVFHTPTRRSAS